MPSSPKIPKEIILKTALELLIEKGYGNVTIKAVAERLNSSTQPISWHFGNMDCFRKTLAEYAISYANSKMKPKSQNSVSAFTEMGSAYVDIAFDSPNLFKYLYLNENGNYCVGTPEMLLSAINNQELLKEMVSFLTYPKKVHWNILLTLLFIHMAFLQW